MFSEWKKLFAEATAFLSDANAIWLAVGTTSLALLFFGLWLRARAGSGEAELRKQLKTARNEITLLRGDVIQSKRDRTAEVEKLTRELENLRAAAEGREPPELEQWKQRALEAERRLESDREQHQAELEKLLAPVKSPSSAEQTMFAPILPSGASERVERLEQDLAEARQELEAATKTYENELTALAERLNAEKAEALVAQQKQHAAELQALQSRLDAVAAAPTPEHLAAEEVSSVAEPDLPDSARFAFLQVVVGANEGTRFSLPYEVATIGRSDSNTIVLQEPRASRAHAEIRFDGVDFTITDRNSTNGTLVNDELVTSAQLAFGDLIGIGETRLKFTCEAIEAAANDPSFAQAAFRAMLRDAPRCRPAMQGLIDLLEQNGQHEEETRVLTARLQGLDGGDTSSEAAGSDDQHVDRPERTH